MFGGIQRALGFARDEDADRMVDHRLLILAHEHGQTIGLTETEVNQVFDRVREVRGRVPGPELRARLNTKAYALNPNAWRAFG